MYPNVTLTERGGGTGDDNYPVNFTAPTPMKSSRCSFVMNYS